MRAFVIADASKRKAKPVGVLFWEPDNACTQGRFALELASHCDETTLPLSLSFCLDRPGKCATPEESEQWVKSRIVPEDRHNITEVLLANGLVDYDEVSLFAACKGRSSDDDFLAFEVSLTEELEQALSARKYRTTIQSNRKAATEHPLSRADTMLNAVERTRRSTQVEYAVVDFPDANESHETSPPRKNAKTHNGTHAEEEPACSSAARRIGAQVRARRKEAGLTQAQLAARAGITQVVLSRIETGAGNPTLDLLEEISFALGTSLNVSLGASPNVSLAE